MFNAALFTIAKRWQTPTCPSLDEWKNKMWCIATRDAYYAVLKKNNILTILKHE